MEAQNKDGSINQTMLRGSMWAVAMRWSVRLIGLVSTVILARLLTPADFGIVAMAFLVIGFLDVFTEFGVGMLLLREQHISDDDCNTAWTLWILQGVVLASLLLLVAPYAAEYFSEPRIVDVLRVLALVPLIEGFRNIGMILARKELDFSTDFRFQVFNKFTRFICVVGISLVLLDYWGLVFGQVTAALALVAISYSLHSYRPRLCLKSWRKFFNFSILIMLANSGKYFSNKIDAIVVGGAFGTASLGVYNVASQLAAMATEEVVQPVNRSLIAVYAKVSHDKAALAKAFHESFSVVALIILPLAVGLAAISEQFVFVVFGSKWLEAAPLLTWLSIYALNNGLINLLSGQILVTIRREALTLILRYARLAVVAPVFAYVAYTENMEKAAQSLAILGMLMTPVIILITARALNTKSGKFYCSLVRPVMAAMVMFYVIRALPAASDYALVNLILSFVCGACAYTLTLSSLWLLRGAPNGAESAIVGQARSVASGILEKWKAR